MSGVSYRSLKVWVLRIQLFGTSFSGIGSAQWCNREVMWHM